MGNPPPPPHPQMIPPKMTITVRVKLRFWTRKKKDIVSGEVFEMLL